MTGILIIARVISMAYGFGLKMKSKLVQRIISRCMKTYPKMHLVLRMALLVPAYHILF